MSEVVSIRLELEWRLNRRVLRLPLRTRFTPPEPIDAFHPPDEEPAALPMPATPPGK